MLANWQMDPQVLVTFILFQEKSSFADSSQRMQKWLNDRWIEHFTDLSSCLSAHTIGLDWQGEDELQWKDWDTEKVAMIDE